MRKALFLFTILYAISGWPQNGPAEATLLLGIRGLEENHKQKVYNTMERDFRGTWDADFSTKVVRDASYLDLFKTLRNVYQQVVFWVSHAGSYNGAPGISNGLVTDAYGDDVKNLFKVLPENLYWLGLVGCKAEPILRKFEEEGYYDHLAPRFVSSTFARSFPFGINVLHNRLRGYTGVIIDSSDSLVRAYHGLRSSMHAAKWPAVNAAEPPNKSCLFGPALHIEAVRSREDSTKSLAAISIEANEYPLTIFDRESTQTYYPLLLPMSEMDGLDDVSLVIQGREGFDPLAETDELGAITFWSPTMGLYWERVEIGGRPLGKTQNVYRLTKESKAQFATLRSQGVYFSRPCYNTVY
jgi:hypothetical protein